MSAQLRASIVVIGDEILAGYVQDANSGWLAGRLAALGIPLDRIVTVSDEQAEIVAALDEELARRRPRVLLTSGGIGSTPDDRTIASVAACLGLGTAVLPELDARVQSWAAHAHGEGMPVDPLQQRAMRKMAEIPQGAFLLGGTPTSTPGIALDVDGGLAGPDGATIVILPGVPSELRRIVRQGVEPDLLAGRGNPQHVAEVTHPYPESVLSPLLHELVEDFPDVHVGSYPGRECLIRLKGAEPMVAEAMRQVRRRLAELADDPSAARLRANWQAAWDSSGDSAR